MSRFGLFFLAFGLSASAIRADELKFQLRPISEADSVIAVYHKDDGLASSGLPKIILAAWPDGQIVWSNDRIMGGAPYRAGRVDPKKITALLAKFEKDGLFDEKNLGSHYAPDSQYISVFVKSGKKQVKMESWHELLEASDDTVVDPAARSLGGARRLDVLRKLPSDELFFRFLWSETRGKISDLIPNESRPSNGEPHMLHGVLTWREPAANPKADVHRDK
jgi:hypothetical protein